MAIPLGGGGSGGAFELRVYGSNRAHEPKLIQTIRTEEGIGEVWIADGRLNIREAYYLPGEAHCCASHHTDLAYAYRQGRFSLASQVTAANATPAPVDPYNVNSTSTATATLAAPVPNSNLPPQRVRISGGSRVDCETDSISSKSDDGDVLVMLSGATYHVSAVDQVDSAIWLVTEDVVICDEGGVYKIINKDENGASVEASKVTE